MAPCSSRPASSSRRCWARPSCSPATSTRRATWWPAPTNSRWLNIAKGVKIAAGCDIFVSGQMYGANSMEIVHLINAGMTDLEAIEAMTANGQTLGPQGPDRPTRGRVRRRCHRPRRQSADDQPVWGDPDRVTHV